MVFTVAFTVALILAAARAEGAHPNNSILPQASPPTRYGLTLLRADAQPPVAAPPQAPPAPGDGDAYRARVEALELRGGPYAPALVEPLQALGQSLQAQGRTQQALGHYRRALHLQRVNAGLYDAAQVPLLQALAESQLALGDRAGADRTRDRLYRVQQANLAPGSAAMVQAAIEHAEWKRSAYLAGEGAANYQRLLAMHRTPDELAERLAGESPDDPAQLPYLYQRMRAEYLLSRYESEPRAITGRFGYGPLRHPASGFSPGAYAASANAPGRYVPRIAAAGTHIPGTYAAGTYEPGTSLDAEAFRLLRKHNFRNGRKTLERIIHVLQQQPKVDAAELARAHVALGDWFMWWHQPARAIGAYEQAWQVSGGAAGAWFATPVELPADAVFQPPLPSGEGNLNARARVRFDVSRIGQVRNIEFVAVEVQVDTQAQEVTKEKPKAGPVTSTEANTEANTEASDKRETARLALYRLLHDARFRPLLQDGEAVAATGIEREYRFAY
ncbi:hypothetical protein [Parahaliea mediterranea]|uniref:hypothetical protein n=1 Tax=Parahaliea mediterranea TaxID=651086 RepID=UPI001300877B|nr:hypothetical protein [Parahaliea mediterranea]